jgi:hypothetical protein
MCWLNPILIGTALLALGVPAGAQNPPTSTAKQPSSTAVTQTTATQTGKNTATPKSSTPKPGTVAKGKKGRKTQQLEVQAPPPAPPPPPTPAQLPPTAPRVSMRGGLLTIEANNATLADVLAGVRRETKAAIDLPPGASGERVVASLGPGTPQNVLAALLNGSRFDYIILGSQDQPEAVQRVILRAKSGPEPAPAAIAANGSPVSGGNRVQPAAAEQEDDQAAPAEEAPDENNQPPQQEIDNEQQQGQPQNQQQQQQQQPGVKTPEQLLEELRQMQQQQQQGQPPPQPQQQPPPDEQ